VSVIDEDGTQLGVMNIHQARKHAVDKELDLVEVAPNERPPVCKILDYGKYKYQQAKKDTAKHKTVSLKEIKVRPQTDEHDLAFKMKNARKFLGQGHKLKVTMFFRGREIVHKAIGRKLIDRIIEELSDIATVIQHAKMEGNRMIIIMIPGADKKK
jgi:translation initiation factor IF-3